MTDLQRMTDAELATHQAGWKPGTPDDILSNREWDRRRMNQAFALQLELANKNQRWGLWLAVAGMVSTLVAAVVGGAVAYWLK